MRARMHVGDVFVHCAPASPTVVAARIARIARLRRLRLVATQRDSSGSPGWHSIGFLCVRTAEYNGSPSHPYVRRSEVSMLSLSLSGNSGSLTGEISTQLLLRTQDRNQVLHPQLTLAPKHLAHPPAPPPPPPEPHLQSQDGPNPDVEWHAVRRNSKCPWWATGVRASSALR